MSMNKLKEIELFDGKTLDIIFKDIYERTTEERERALKVFDNIAERLKEDDDVFMIGDKANPYLDIAQKSTDNLTKMIVAAQRLLDLETSGERGIDKDTIIDILENMGDILPEEIKNRDVPEQLPEDNIDKFELIDNEDTELEIKKFKVGDKFSLEIDGLTEENKKRFV